MGGGRGGGSAALCNTVPSVRSSFTRTRENGGGGDDGRPPTSQPHPVFSRGQEKQSQPLDRLMEELMEVGEAGGQGAGFHRRSLSSPDSQI